MAREIDKLSALKVSRLRKPGMYGDGAGLWLQVRSAASKSWLFRYSLNKKSREMGLGSLNAISLAEARAMATDCRKLLIRGIDPIEARMSERSAARIGAAKSKTFKECAVAYINAHEAGWRNAKHGRQWHSTLETFVF